MKNIAVRFSLLVILNYTTLKKAVCLVRILKHYLVRSKGGLKVEQVTNRYGELLNDDFDEIIIHAGVNSTEHESEEGIMNKFRTLSESIKESHEAFSGILRRSDKPELNQKITRINSFLRKTYV